MPKTREILVILKHKCTAANIQTAITSPILHIS